MKNDGEINKNLWNRYYYKIYGYFKIYCSVGKIKKIKMVKIFLSM